MGIHAGDHAIYPDCRQEFRDIDFDAFKAGNWDYELVHHYTPYLHENKFTILEDGQKSCDILGLNFNEVYKRTNTSYKPIFIRHSWSDTQGNWYSDYKSAASVERIEAFIKLGRPDPVAYADETGPVTWEVAKAHVEQVLAKHNS
jgi:7-cyano-7-deazaguanine synthase